MTNPGDTLSHRASFGLLSELLGRSPYLSYTPKWECDEHEDPRQRRTTKSEHTSFPGEHTPHTHAHKPVLLLGIGLKPLKKTHWFGLGFSTARLGTSLMLLWTCLRSKNIVFLSMTSEPTGEDGHGTKASHGLCIRIGKIPKHHEFLVDASPRSRGHGRGLNCWSLNALHLWRVILTVLKGPSKDPPRFIFGGSSIDPLHLWCSKASKNPKDNSFRLILRACLVEFL